MPVGFPPPDDQAPPPGERPGRRSGPQESEAEREARGRLLRSYGSFAGLGLQCGACLTAFTLGGLWLDRRLGSLPWLLLLGVAIGLVLVFWLIVQRAR